VAETFFQEITRYVGFDTADGEALRRFHPLARPHFEQIAARFYERILEHPAATAVLRTPTMVERLRVSLRAWMDLLLSGPWDEAYFALRSRIGRMHVQVRLPQRYMFTAMSAIRQDFEAVIDEHIAAPDEREAVRRALGKLIELELAIMLETYHESYVAAVQRFERAGKTLLERRLAISEARYQAIVENAAVAVVALEADGKVALFNRRAEAVSEYSRNQVVGVNLFETICHPQSRRDFERAVAAALDGAEPPTLEARIVTATGAERWLRWHITTLATTGAPLACAIGLDTTEERTLAERTRRAESLASLGTLAAGLAHEIRNPLNAAQLQLMLVERRVGKLGVEDSSGAMEAARTVRDELHRLAGLVEDFLAFARPTELRLAGGNLSETAATVVGFLAPLAEEAGVALTLEAPDGVFARYDEERIKQVLINLLRNGIEAAGRGGRASLRCAREAGTAVLEVKDSGPGLPPDVPIFEPFTTTKTTGTGLGLPIVHRIVHDHGGDVRPERRGDDTVFRVELPIDGPPGRDAPVLSRSGEAASS
jgi:PAS domain S-box-containing protein